MPKTAPEQKTVLPSRGGSYVREGGDLKRVHYTKDATGGVATEPKRPTESSTDQAPSVPAAQAKE